MESSRRHQSELGFNDVSQFHRVDQICDLFERAWKDGPLLKDYLSLVPAAERDNLRRELENLQNECEERQQEVGETSVAQETAPHGSPSATGNENGRPARIGRYRVERLLGQGGFGQVYLAHDERLQRLVAVKVPHAELVSNTENVDAHVFEARTIASLDHPHIVPVYDIGTTNDYPCFVVSKYVDGCDLATRMKAEPLSSGDAADLVATVAAALHYAHTQGVVHRDVKPGNILIEGNGTPYVVDFGLALREENIGLGPKYLGTPAYMSPEQASGEGHRVDARSDIFSLGVVLYELLTGNRPFPGKTQADLQEQLARCEPRPVREHDSGLPMELARICHKALAKRANRRYASAQDLADDLWHFLATQPGVPNGAALEGKRIKLGGSAATSCGSGAAPATVGAGSVDGLGNRIVPKGLRCFDAADADFFLELLPGLRDRDGLPESVRFWKTRIEGTEPTEPEDTFPIGLIYGPSGCGKSSLVKAGLLPHLSDEVISVCVEATPDETESRLLQALRKRFPAAKHISNLKSTLSALRRGQGVPLGKKVLIVLDQFEQWLHAKGEEDNSELVQALRQCDGSRVQCIVMVRDDFWVPAARFMQELEVQLLDGQNSAAVDLFPIRHAERVLTCFGQAFGTLSNDAGDVPKPQRDFITQAVAALAEEGRVISVRLALFAEMMKDKSWTPASLRQIGGVKGVGVTFLEETFGRRSAHPHHRRHEKAARQLLRSLLPESGADIKAEAKSYGELLEASGYSDRPADCDDLIRILDHELRLITPTDAEDVESDDPAASPPKASRKCYQLTHDYLVRSLRDWLTRKQHETRQGRAELCLAERSALWNSKPENRHLPSWWEHAGIRWFTNKRSWTESQRRMMGTARRVYGLRTALAGLLFTAAVLSGIGIRNTLREQQLTSEAKIQEREDTTRAEGLVQSLLSAEISQVPFVISDIQGVREWADPLLNTKLSEADDHSAQKLHLALALLPVDEQQLDYLSEQLPVCTLNQFPVVCDALAPYQGKFNDALWKLTADNQQDAAQRFQAAAALAKFAPEDERWNDAAPFVAQYLTSTITAISFGQWLERLQLASHQLTSSLEEIAFDSDRLDKQREAAALALADYCRQAPDKLSDLILVTDEPKVFSTLVDALQPYAADVKPRLMAAVHAPMPADSSIEQRDAHWRRQSMAAVTLVHLGHGDVVWQMLEFTADPSLRSFIIHHLGKFIVEPDTLAARLEVETDVSIRRALIQSLGGLGATQSESPDRIGIVEHLQALYVGDSDPGIHASASWALQQWNANLSPLPPTGEAALTTEQEQRMVRLAKEVENMRNRLVAFDQNELPARQGAWERALQEQAPDFPSVLNDSLIAHYPLDETDGLQGRNAVEGELAGTYQGRGHPEWATGVVGGALRLLGDGQLIGGSPLPLNSDGPFSYGCWMYHEQGLPAVLLSSRNAKRSIGFDLSIERDLSLQVIIAGEPPGELSEADRKRYSPHYLSTITDVPLDSEGGAVWHHVLVTYDGSGTAQGVVFYVDGKRIPSRVGRDNFAGSTRPDAPVYIGSRRGRYPFQGRIDDVRIFNRELASNDVNRVYQWGVEVLARVPDDQRTAEQRALLNRFYASVDISRQPLQRELIAAETALRDEPFARRFAATEAAIASGTWSDNRLWYINSQGQTMVAFRNPAEFGNNKLTHSFAISSRELTYEEYRRFMEDPAIDSAIAPTDDCPAHVVSWFQAAAYCNWLSKQEGIPEDQWIYEPNEVGKYDDGMTIKQNHAELIGYRLPTETEWEYACRAGANTTYSFGEPLSLLRNYAQYIANSGGRSHPAESLLPNDAGLFDMHGNLWEWTLEAAYGQFSPVRADTSRALRGGAFYLDAALVRPETRTNYTPSMQITNIGFRPARTLRERGQDSLF